MGNLIFLISIFLQSYTGVEFLRVGVGSRSIALGNAYVGISDEPYGIFYNPAGISTAPYLHISSFYGRWFLDTDLAGVASTIPLGQKGVLGIGLRGLYTDNIELRTEDDPWNYDYYRAYFLNYSIAYAGRINNFGFGIGLNAINAKIESEDGNSFFLNTGIGYYTKSIDFGLSLSNLGTKILNTGLPVNIRGGICAKSIPNLRLSADIIKQLEDDFSYSIGVEYSIVDILKLRLGYNNDFYSNSFINKISGGFGLKAGNIVVDYSVSQAGTFGLTHFFTLSYGLFKKEEKTVKEILEKDKMMSVTYLKQGIKYYYLGKYDEALNSWDLSFIWDPNNKETLDWIAKAEQKLKDKRIEEFLNEGESEFGQGNYLNAIYSLEKVIKLNPELRKARDLKMEAEKRLKKGVSEDIAEKIGQGISNFESGNYKKAIEIWSEIIEIQPDNKTVQSYINNAKSKINEDIKLTSEKIENHISEGELKAARSLVNQMLNKYPYDEIFKKQIAFIKKKINDAINKHLEDGHKFFKAGKYNDAEKEFYSVLDYEPKNSKALRYLEETRKQISRSDKEDAERYYFLGIDAYTKDLFELAIEYWEKVLKIDPSYPNARKNIERARIKLKELNK
jgi:tetratricopeptide (TPR) repeat protein